MVDSDAPPTGPAPGPSLVDCDVHVYFENGLDDLLPHLPKAWRERMGLGRTALVNSGQIGLPKNEFYVNATGGVRLDATRSGEPPGSSPDTVIEQLLDGYGVDRAILLGGPNSGLGTLPDPDVAAAFASAYNEWLCERWLAVDPRFRGALLVAPQDPEQAVAEIERVADRPGIAAIHMPIGRMLAGERHLYPIYAAAQRHALPIMLHPGSTESIYANAPQLGGMPTYYVEWHTLLTIPMQATVTSLICHGVFERFPELRYVLVEGGFAWACDLLWRLDRDWKALRDEIPWVRRPPSDYLRDHIRFTTQPFYEPGKREHLLAICDALDAERTLMFSSDYPHWDFDNPKRTLMQLPREMREPIFASNAVETFGDRLA